MLNVQQALVFGPPDELVLGFLITVATVGTITFTMEVGNFANKVGCHYTLRVAVRVVRVVRC